MGGDRGTGLVGGDRESLVGGDRGTGLVGGETGRV